MSVTAFDNFGRDSQCHHPLCDMLKHPDEDAQTTAATILEHLLDPRSADGLIDAMASPAVREIAVRTLKKLGAVRDRIDATFHALRDVEGPANGKKLAWRRSWICWVSAGRRLRF